MPREVTAAYLLADKAQAPLKVTKSDNGLDVALPAQGLDPIATVLVLKTS
jgi:alpha-L-fucosidase